MSGQQLQPSMTSEQTIFQWFAGSFGDAKKMLYDLNNFSPPSYIQTNQEMFFEMKDLVSSLLEYGSLELESHERENYESLINLLDRQVLGNFLLNKDEDSLREVVFMLRPVAISLNISLNIGIYTPEELFSILSEEGGGYELDRMLFTLKQASMGQDQESYTDILLPYLDIDAVVNQKIFSWEDALTLTIMLQAVWSYFSLLDVFDKARLIESYTYKSIVLGIPVRHYLEEFLYNTTDVINYAFSNDMILRSLDDSRETLPVDISEGNYQSLKEIINKYAPQTGESSIDSYGQTESIRNIYQGQKNRDKYVNWLLETVYIVNHVQDFDLVEMPKYKEVTEETLASDELIQLLQWFYNKNTWPKIVEYYRQEKPRIVLNAIFLELFRHYDLAKQNVVDMLIDFTELLKKEKIIDSEKDIIEFHEEDGHFHWNADFLSGL